MKLTTFSAILPSSNKPIHFIHSFRIFLRCLFKSTTTTTTQRHFRLRHWYCVGVNTPKRHRQLWVKDLPKVPTWRLERDLNPRPFGRKAPNLPLSHHAPFINPFLCDKLNNLPSIDQFNPKSIHKYLYMTINSSISSILPSIHQLINPPIHQSAHPSIHKSIHPSAYSSIRSSIQSQINRCISSSIHHFNHY